VNTLQNVKTDQQSCLNHNGLDVEHIKIVFVAQKIVRRLKDCRLLKKKRNKLHKCETLAILLLWK